jgi:hypothetical protein
MKSHDACGCNQLRHLGACRLFSRRSLGIPERVIALPLAGVHDLKERLRLLLDTLGSTRQPVMSAAEMAAILECSLARLRDVANEQGTADDESESTRATA